MARSKRHEYSYHRAGSRNGRSLSAIVSQQVSVASANAIWARLEAAGLCDPAAMAAADEATLRAVGLSRQKAR